MSNTSARKRDRETDSLEANANKRPKYQSTDRHSSFYTTVRVFLGNGMANVSKCCIDSGYETYGQEGSINPSVVTKLGLTPYRSPSAYVLADGSTGSDEYGVNVPLTFETLTSTVTIDTFLHVTARDLQSHSILLGTGILPALGGVHDHRSRPTKFLITKNRARRAGYLMSDAYWTTPDATYVPKRDDSYIVQLARMPAFALLGLQALPEVAWKKIGTSRELHAMITMRAEEGVLRNAGAAQRLEELVQVVASKERDEYLRLWRRDKERGIARELPMLSMRIDRKFTPSKAEDAQQQQALALQSAGAT